MFVEAAGRNRKHCRPIRHNRNRNNKQSLLRCAELVKGATEKETIVKRNSKSQTLYVFRGQSRTMTTIPPSDFNATNCAFCHEAFPPMSSWKYTGEFTFFDCCGISLCFHCCIDFATARISGKLAKLTRKKSKRLAKAASKDVCPGCREPAVDRQSKEFLATTGLSSQNTVLERLANSGHTKAQLDLAMLLERQDREQEATVWLQKAAQNGVAKAQVQLALDRLIRNEESKDSVLSSFVSLLSHSGVAAEVLGMIFERGLQVSKSLEAAEVLYEISIKHGQPTAALHLSKLWIDQKRHLEAANLLRQHLAVKEDKHLDFFQEHITAAQYWLCQALKNTLDWKNMHQDSFRVIAGEIMFWAQRADRNGEEKAATLLTTVRNLLISSCGYCQTANPTLLCDCGLVAYCDKKCRRMDKIQKHHTKQECKRLLRQQLRLEASMDYACSLCRRPSPPLQCSACNEAYYCDANCQKRHWLAGHKEECSEHFSGLD